MSAAAAREDALPSCWTVSGSGSVLKVTLASRVGPAARGVSTRRCHMGEPQRLEIVLQPHRVSDSPPMSGCHELPHLTVDDVESGVAGCW